MTIIIDSKNPVEKIAMIVAGGSGTRMKESIPKQFLLLNGYPVLMHTLEQFHRYEADLKIIVVLPEDQITAWELLCNQYGFKVAHEIRQGGQSRFHSVKKNLEFIPDQCLIGVHDGVRPLVSRGTIDRCYETARKLGNAIPCIEIPETVRWTKGDKSIQVNREEYRLIQTPQVFKGDILKEAYEQEYNPDFTDDAGVVENSGHDIHLVEGNPENIKITFKKDLRIAETLLAYAAE